MLNNEIKEKKYNLKRIKKSQPELNHFSMSNTQPGCDTRVIP